VHLEDAVALRWLQQLARVATRTRELVGSHSQRELARGQRLLGRVQRLGDELGDLSDDALRDRALPLRARAQGGEPAESLMAETFALVREVSGRLLGMRHYDVQILGGFALARGNVVEMRTGEGKTLVATLPTVLHGLYGAGVHVITVNDYLAARDAAWMGPVYRFFGLEVGVVTEDLDPERQREARRAAYAADITYVTNHELVFDYLRDNLALERDEQVLRPLATALVDELDLLLLDEAGTPLIISGESGDDTARCARAAQLVAALRPGTHYRVDHKGKQASITEEGWERLERALGIDNLAAAEQLPWQHRLHHALAAQAAYQRDVDYVVQGGELKLIDEHTGRVSPDKRLADGLHQALEAKEKLEVQAEDQTLAKVSYQLFFRLYPQLAGMTGTAYSARRELESTYGLKVVIVPTNRPLIRDDLADLVFVDARAKLEATAAEVAEAQQAGRPVLIGTTSVRESEQLSGLLRAAGVAHEVLNAKDYSREAEIIAQAGRRAAVTVSTNMAGRGVDILLGGNPGDPPTQEAVRDAGGLLVLGTGLHDARRIDDQLRGRAGRQGDPGTSRFLLSLDDPIYKKFGELDHDRFEATLDQLRERLRGHPPDEPIDDGRVLRALRELQKKVEAEEESQRREVLRFDTIVDQQRRTIYAWRQQLLDGDTAAIGALLEQASADLLDSWQAELFEQVDGADEAFDAAAELAKAVGEVLGAAPSPPRRDESIADALSRIRGALAEALGARLSTDATLLTELTPPLLITVDALWTEHLRELERLEDDVHLRGYAELDPLLEFRREAHEAYQQLLTELRQSLLAALFSADPGGDR
jgi:preprotein translocase subunit SecA